jgi:serine/threonine protein kinase
MIKKISRLFEDPIEAKRFHREVKVMKSLNHENVSPHLQDLLNFMVQVLKVIEISTPSRQQEDLIDIYVVLVSGLLSP